MIHLPEMERNSQKQSAEYAPNPPNTVNEARIGKGNNSDQQNLSQN